MACLPAAMSPLSCLCWDELHDSDDYRDYLRQKEKIQGEIAEFKRKQVDKFIRELRQHVGDYLLGAQEAVLLEPGAKFDTFAGEHKLNPIVLRRWMKDLEKRDHAADPIFGPWFRVSSLTNSRPSQVLCWPTCLTKKA
jgi:hypothetical protein